jgi:opine dehydrogenase
VTAAAHDSARHGAGHGGGGPRVCIVGAGHGAQAAAVDLSLRGVDVILYNRTLERLEAVRRQGGFRYTGARGEGFVPFTRLTDDLGSAVVGRDVIMLVVPSTAHEYYAGALAPHLTSDIVVFLNPGQMGGGLHFAAELRKQGYHGDLLMGETATLTYATRVLEPGLVWIKRVVQKLSFSAWPTRNLSRVYPIAQRLYPDLVATDHALITAFEDLNAVEHPPGVVLNAGWIEFTRGDFRFYYEGITPAVARVVERVDAERLAIVRALNERSGLGIPERSFVAVFHADGYTTDEAATTGSVYQALHASETNKSTRAPDSFDHRYVVEDIGFGLIPMCGLAQLAGVDVPCMEGLVTMASVLTGRDFRRDGRTLRKMGLDAVPVESLRTFLYEGPNNSRSRA